MGFDVYGKNPVLVEGAKEPEFPENYSELSDEEQSAYWNKKSEYQTDNPGTYFRASVWSWRPLLEIMSNTCDHILDEETLSGLAFNDGFGPDDQETCTGMADAIEAWLNESEWMGKNEYSLASECRVKKDTGEFVSAKELEDEKVWNETRSAYGIEISHILEFCQFLRKCGGFQAC